MNFEVQIMEGYYGIILAAGEGKRMKSKLPKVLHGVCGKAMLDHVIDALKKADVQSYVTVVGHEAEKVKVHLGSEILTAYQKEQLGTGHAVMCCDEFLSDKEGIVIILAGDVPLITGNIVRNMLDYHKKNGLSVTVLTAEVDDPSGFGRIVRGNDNGIERIVEHKDADENQKRIREVNSGIYCFDIKELRSALKELTNNNSQNEYYLTDAIEIVKKRGCKAGAYKTCYSELMGIGSGKETVPAVFMGVNSRIQLSEANAVMRKRINSSLMTEGVTFIDAESTYIDAEVKVGRDTVIYPGVILEGKTIIGEDCLIGHGSRIVDSVIENGAEIENSVILNSTVKENAKVGPFAYIRPESVIGKRAKIGDFVEVKKSVIGDETKVAHLTYIGDAEVGKGCNFGCGTVLVNYDGTKKYKTLIGDNAFIGCNTNLISPVHVGNNAYIAAGSTITDDIPDGSLAVARARQVNKENWVAKKGIWKK